MSTVGQSNIQITADDQQARRTIGGFFRGMEAQGRRFTNRMQRFDPLIGVTNSVKNTRQTLAGLQDDFEGLGEGKTFQRITKSLNRVQNGLKTTGQVSQKSLKEMQKEIERVRSTLNELGDDQPFEEMREALAQTERQFQSFQSTTRRFRFNQLENLPDHLKPFQRELNESRRQMREMSREGTKSLEDLADAAVKSSVGLERITSVTKSGKSAIKIIQDLGDSTKETQLAILGLNRNGTVKISTEETTRRLGQFKEELEDSKRKLEALRDAGDFGSYEAGMRVVEKKLADVNRAMYAASKGGQAYQKMINELGVNTSDAANQAAIAMEAYKDKFIRSVDLMNAKSNQSKKMMDILPEVSHIQRVDKFFLGIGNRLENMGKQGTAANIALNMLGRNASMKDLNDRIMLINQGLMRMNQVAIGVGIALAGFTAAMFNAAKGPEVADVFEQRGQLLLDYQKAVEDRTQEIVDTWGLFEKAEVEKTKPETLMKNLQGQVDVMKNWASNIDSLAKRGIDEGLLDSLRKMGPEAAGQIQALTKMSDSELNNYVALWKEKHALARKEALTELEGLQKETSQKIKELENSLTPLGISLEKAKSTWLQALQPFIDIWGKIAAKVVDGATAIGEFVNKLNELNPSITASAGMFLYLFNAISLILAPMAIGIGRANGMKAAFSATFLIIKPFVLGFLRIAGAATVVSGALVLVGGTFIKLWKNSENLRSAVMNLWRTLQEAGSTIAAPLVKAFKEIGDGVVSLLNIFVGSNGNNMTSFWQTLGDKIAIVANKISDIIRTITPIIAKFIESITEWEGFIPTIAGIAAAFATLKVINKVKDWWATLNIVMLYSVDYIKKARAVILLMFNPLGRALVLTQLWTKAQAALNLVMSLNPVGLIIAAIVGLGAAFVVAYKKSETFRNFVNGAFNSVKNVIQNVVSYVDTALSSKWGNALKKFAYLTPIGAVVGAVKGIKNAMSDTLSKADVFGTGISESTKKAVGAYLKLDNDATLSLNKLAWSQTTITGQMANDITSKYDAMSNKIQTSLDTNYSKQVEKTKTLFATNSALNSQEEAKILSKMEQDNTAKKAKVQQYENEIKNIITNAKNEKRSLSEQERQDIATIQEKMRTTAVQTMSKGSTEQKAILESLRVDSTNITAGQAAAVVQNSKKQRDQTVSNANEQYNKTISQIIKMRDESGVITKDQADKMIQQAKRQKDEATKKANEMHNNVVNEAKKQAGEHVDQVNWETGQVKSKWQMFKEDIKKKASDLGSGVKSAFSSMWSKTKEISKNIYEDMKSRFNDIVSGAKKLPGRIGDGIKSMASGVKKGVTSFANTLVSAMGKGLNGAIDGVNWVLGKIGVETSIKKWPIPQYQNGTGGHPGGWFIAGDGGQEELIRFPNGRMILSPATDTLYNGPKGTEVFSGPETKQLIQEGLIPRYKGGKLAASFKKKKDELWDATKSVAGAAKDKVVSTGKAIKDKAVEVGGNAKDLALDVFEYMDNPKDLMKKVFAKFVPNLPKINGAFGQILTGSVKKVKDKTVDFIKKQISDFGFGGSVGAPSGKGVARWRPVILKAAAAMKEAVTGGDVNAILRQIQRESGGNEKIVQSSAVRDINTRNGNPARGLLQYIPQTFRAYAVKGHNNIYSGYDQLLAWFNNTKWRQNNPGGTRGWGPTGKRKYEQGGIIDRVQMALMGEGNKEEVIIPLEQFKERAIKLLMYAAEKLGFDMTGMFNAQPQTLGASSFSNVQSAMTNMSNKVSPEGLKLQGNSGQVIEVVVHNHTELDGKELAKGSYKYTTEYQERDKRSKSSFQKERG
ncbi:hypothetical protein [Priestia megaterium]|uniref:hypothetical protein n=1 Tax=Priestia megaterium TaxID=1404 RepID=UPI002D80EE74|nr:hypothetical protein [Priestia megaterium]MEB4856084.1 hypothetical protein [Priestia megaterium]